MEIYLKYGLLILSILTLSFTILLYRSYYLSNNRKRFRKNLLLQPESFVGKISTDSSTFEIMQPVEFSRHGRTIGLSLSDEIISIEWKFTDKSGLFNDFIGDMNCFIYFDKKFSMISFLLSFNNGTTSLRREISAPCDSREEAIRLGWYLKSGGIKPPV